MERRRDDVVQHFGNPVDRLRDEGDVLDAERDRQRVERIQVGAAGCRIAFQALRRGRRRLHLGQAVDLIVVQEHGQIHVVADRMNPMRGADAAAVAVARVDEHVQIRAGDPDALGDRQGAPVDAVKAVGPHVVRKAAGAPDARDEHRLLRSQLLVTAQPLHGREDGVVAAARAPARHAALVVLQLVARLVHAE
jgi:hypothetical protein